MWQYIWLLLIITLISIINILNFFMLMRHLMLTWKENRGPSKATSLPGRLFLTLNYIYTVPKLISHQFSFIGKHMLMVNFAVWFKILSLVICTEVMHRTSLMTGQLEKYTVLILFHFPVYENIVLNSLYRACRRRGV